MSNKDKVLEISKKLGLTHVGSCLSVLPILEEIYAKKKPEDKVILDNAHAHLAHLVVKLSDLQKTTGELIGDVFIEGLIKEHGIHCDRKAGCDVSGGSLGHGLGIGMGVALANPDVTVYVVVSDGSMNEGSNWEALRLIKLLKIKNIKIYANINGSTALEEIDRDELSERLRVFCPDINIRYTDNGLPELFGVKGHYAKI